MRTTVILALAAAASLPLAACTDTSYGNGRPGYSSDRGDRGGYRGDRRNRGDRDNRGYVLSERDQIYRDRDGNYYCKHRDGTRGAIAGGLAGGVLGNIIAPNGSKTLGTILGAAGGALAGQAIDKNNVRCE